MKTNTVERITAWKTTKTEYYTRSTARPNRNGLTESAQSRRVTYWSARRGDRIAQGHATRRDAIAALESLH